MKKVYRTTHTKFLHFIAIPCDISYRNFPISRWVSCPCKTLSLAVAHIGERAADAQYDDGDV
jgi:hypothetical protein